MRAKFPKTGRFRHLQSLLPKTPCIEIKPFWFFVPSSPLSSSNGANVGRSLLFLSLLVRGGALRYVDGVIVTAMCFLFHLAFLTMGIPDMYCSNRLTLAIVLDILLLRPAVWRPKHLRGGLENFRMKEKLLT